MEIRTHNIFFSITEEYFPHLVIGFFLLGAAMYCFGKGQAGWKSWRGIFNEIKPSTSSQRSPFDQTLTGCGNLLAACFCAGLTLLFIGLGVEQLLFDGVYWSRFVVLAEQWLSQR